MKNSINLDDKTREASHAGSWYDAEPEKLNENLNNWLTSATKKLTIKLLKAIIGPHAGYRYSGSTAAWAYCNINPDLYNRVILLGPSHHTYFVGCGLPSCNQYSTPFGNIQVDQIEVEKLSEKDNFILLTKQVEEDEHSLEMHLPYIKKLFQNKVYNALYLLYYIRHKLFAQSFIKKDIINMNEPNN